MTTVDPGSGQPAPEPLTQDPRTPDTPTADTPTPEPLTREALAGRLDHIEALLSRGAHELDERTSTLRGDLAPAIGWARGGELRWPVSVVVLLVVVMQMALPAQYRLESRWLLAAGEVALLVAVTALNPHRIERPSLLVRTLGLTLLVLMSLANLDAVARLVYRLLTGTEGSDATALLLTGAAIWLVNVVIFALWYWEFDRGGPVTRATGTDPNFPDFLFAQMTTPEVAPPTWRPTFLDYLYLSFTNATAFSPTDTLPLARWAKLLMMLQSAVSLVTVALVIARAVNVLK
jgi:hypothetical protein